MSMNVHLWFEIQNVPATQQEMIHKKAIEFFLENSLHDDLTIEWQGKNKNMLVAFEKHPVVFAGSANGLDQLEKDWIQLSRTFLGKGCKTFLTHGFAN